MLRESPSPTVFLEIAKTRKSGNRAPPPLVAHRCKILGPGACLPSELVQKESGFGSR